MINISEVLETNRMILEENLDVRTITMGISLLDCADASLAKTCDKISAKLMRLAKNLVKTGDEIGREFGIPIVNKRISVTPVALVGATVYATAKDHVTVEGIMTIKSGKLRGQISDGMLCSGTELGVSEEMFPGAGYNGLLVLPEDAVPGEDVKPIVGLDESIFDISITANRPDCQSIIGMAREVRQA